MASSPLLQRLRAPRLKEKVLLVCWLILAGFLALYGVTMCLALLGGVNLRPALIPLLKTLIRPLEIGTCLLYPLVCWWGWTRETFLPKWELAQWFPSLSAPPPARPSSQDFPPPGRRWRKLLCANLFGLLYCLILLPAASAMLSFYGIASARSDGFAAILSQWNYPLGGLHTVAAGIAFIGWQACALTRHRASGSS